jgi:hypothetical protein
MVSDDCPPLFIAMGYLITAIVSFAGIWYLFLWLFTCRRVQEIRFCLLQLLSGIFPAFAFTGYVLVMILFPERAGPLLVPC